MMLKTIGAITVFTYAALLFSAPLLDPVILENEYLKLTVDRQRGATLRSLIDKKNGAEAAREFLSGKYWCGALAEDRLAGEGYPGEITRLSYKGEVRRTGSMQILALECISENEKYPGLAFAKNYYLKDRARYLEVEWRITNTGKTARVITPWVHNIISRDYRNTVLPKRDGVKLIPPSADYFQDPVRNWLGAYNPDSRRLIYFSAGFRKLLKHYYCFWNGYHTLEWTFQPVKLRPEERWTAVYRIGLAEPATVPAAVSEDAVLSYRWADEALVLEVYPTSDLGALGVKVFADGKECFSRNAELFISGKPLELRIPFADLPQKSVPLEVKLFRNGRELEQAGRSLVVCVDPEHKTSVMNTALEAWASSESPYQKVVPQNVTAKLHRADSALSLAEVSPYIKVFEQDRFLKGELNQELRTLRNSRFYRQFVIANHGNAPLTFRLNRRSAVLKHGADRLPVSVRRIGFIGTKQPTGFDLNSPVGRYPDPLLPLDSDIVTVPPKSNLPLFLEVFVPAAQAVGNYEGVILLTNGKERLELPVSCTVLPAALPARSTLRSTAGCWALSPELLKAVGSKDTPAEFQKKCRSLYYRHRLTPRENGVKWTFDADMEKQMAELEENHAVSIAVPDFVIRKPDAFKKAVEVLRRHHLYKQAFYYTIDEAPADLFPKVIEDCRKIHTLFPDFKVLGTIYEEDVSALYGSVNIWCRSSIRKEPWHEIRRRAGDEFMSSNLPGVHLEAPGIAPILTFLRMKECGYSGFLFWNMIGGYGKDNPWENIECAGQNGNAHLLYPHASGPVETLRWKYIAKGVELFDLLSMLEKSEPDKYMEIQMGLKEVGKLPDLERLYSRLMDLL